MQVVQIVQIVQIARIGAAIAIVAAVGAGCSKSGPEAAGGFMSGPVPVLIAQAVQKTVPIQLHAIGTVEAYSTVSVRSQIDGKIAEVHFHEGENVKRGDLLVTIDPRPLASGAASGPGQSRPRPRAACTGRQ